MDPSAGADLSLMARRLSKAQALHGQLQRCTLSRLREVLAIARDDMSNVREEEEEEHGRISDGAYSGEDGRPKLPQPTDHVRFLSPLPIVVLGLPPLLPPFARLWHTASQSTSTPLHLLARTRPAIFLSRRSLVSCEI